MSRKSVQFTKSIRGVIQENLVRPLFIKKFEFMERSPLTERGWVTEVVMFGPAEEIIRIMFIIVHFDEEYYEKYGVYSKEKTVIYLNKNNAEHLKTAQKIANALSDLTKQEFKISMIDFARGLGEY